MNLFLRQDVPAGTLLAVSISGTASANASTGADGAPQSREAQDAAADTGGATIQAVPGRLDAMKWPLLGGFVVVFALFGYLLSRKTVVAVGAGDASVAAIPTGKEKKPKTQPIASVSAPTVEQTPSNGIESQSDVDAAIGTSLDALKDSLFRLELRHQAGTITEEEYARERAKAEKVLRDLVRG